MREPVISARQLTRVYRLGGSEVRAVDGVSLQIDQGEFVAIMGASGSGKTTLMNMLGCLDAPSSGTYLLDAIMEICKGFKTREASRPVIVALTSEGPELSDRHYTQVLEPLRESGAAFHVMVIGRPRNNDEDRSVVLSQGTSETGGRYDTVLASSALPMRMKQVAAELTHQFRVTYARPQSLIPPEKITVASAKPGLTVRGTPMKQSREQDRR